MVNHTILHTGSVSLHCFHRTFDATILATTLALCGCATIGSGKARVYVSPDGQDDVNGSGLSRQRPLRTLRRAADAVRHLVAAGQAANGIDVVLLPGTYRLDSPLDLNHTHSGKAGGEITFRAARKGTVTVAGSLPVDGWKPLDGGVYVADLPGNVDRAPQVYGNGSLLPLARYPNVDPAHPRSGGMLYALDGEESSPKTALIYDREKLNPARWKDIAGGKIVIWPGANWNSGRLSLTRVDPESSTLRFTKARYDIRRGNRFYLEGLFEELDAAGEWFADLAGKKLFVKPVQKGAAPVGISVPVSNGLIQLTGQGNTPASHIVFEGIRFAECLGSAIVLENARACRVVGCEITLTEKAGILLRRLSSDNRIDGCDIAWTGTVGVGIEGNRDKTRTRTAAISGNVIENCHLHHIGTSRNAGGAIDLRPYCGGNITHDNILRHNLIHDTPRKGIMMGGVSNIAELNHIHHVNLEQSDTGAIGLCTRDVKERGCIIRHNLIHDVGGYNMLEPGNWAFPSFCWAVYLDDWTSGTTVTGNILLDAPSGGVHVHSGLDNLIEHNIIRGSDKALIQFSPIKPELQYGETVQMSGNTVRHNIALGAPGTPWLRGAHGDWLSGVAECDQNLLWYGGTEPTLRLARNNGSTWQEWQAAGFDRNSSIAAPTFADGTDWKIVPDTVTAALGIKPIPVRDIGPYESASRFSWPLTSEWEREPPVLTCSIPPAPSPRKRAEIPPISSPVSIDGVLGPKEWQGTALLVLEHNHRDVPTQPRSVAHVGFDHDALYIGMENVVNPAEALKLGPAWGKHEAIEVALRPRAAGPEAPVVVFRGFADGSSYGSNAGGIPVEKARAIGRQCTYAAATAAPLRWLAEVRIPWAAIPGADGKPCELQFNLTCNKPSDKLFLCWKPTGRRSHGVGDEGIIIPKQGE